MSKDVISSSIPPDQDYIELSTIDTMIAAWKIVDAKIKYETCGPKDAQSSKNMLIIYIFCIFVIFII